MRFSPSRVTRPAVRGGWAALAGVVVAAGLVMPATAAPARAGQSASGFRTLPPYVVEWSRLAGQGGNATADLGAAAAGAPVSARVYLAGRDRGGLAAFAAAVSYPRSRSFHDYLTPAQVQARFGPAGDQVSSVRSWLAASGLSITAVTGHYVAVAHRPGWAP